MTLVYFYLNSLHFTLSLSFTVDVSFIVIDLIVAWRHGVKGDMGSKEFMPTLTLQCSSKGLFPVAAYQGRSSDVLNCSRKGKHGISVSWSVHGPLHSFLLREAFNDRLLAWSLCYSLDIPNKF